MKHIVFIPGLGADQRLFQFIEINNCTKQFIKWEKPAKDESFASYLLKLKKQITTKQPPVLIGVSLGGIVAMELRELMPVEKTIIISSIKTKAEMPTLFDWIRRTGLNAIIPTVVLKKSAPVIKPFIMDTSNKKALQLFKDMLHDSDDDFIKRAITFVLEWNRKGYDKQKLIHIHGSNDHIFPLKNISHCDYIIKGGTHDMIMSKPSEINNILNKEISG
jgi:pimeloyl-ACP methyl ester carboxylesterase